MALRRTTLILLIVLGVVIALAVAGYLLYPDQVKDVLNGSSKTNTNANTNSTTTTNTSTTPTNLSTVQDLKGDTAFVQTLKAGSTEISFTTLDRLPNFDQTPAPDGQHYVVLYFNGVDSSATEAVWNALSASQLVDGDKHYSPDKLKVATKVVKNDQGYVVFITPTKTGKLTLESGTGTNVQRLALP